LNEETEEEGHPNEKSEEKGNPNEERNINVTSLPCQLIALGHP